jgi:cellulose synthase (UDP-forming)
MGPSGPFRFANRLRPIDRLALVDTFLFWSAADVFRLFGIVVPILYLMFGIEAVHADFTDTLLHFVPYFVFQSIVMAWLTDWRILPIMADVSQLLAAKSSAQSFRASPTPRDKNSR